MRDELEIKDNAIANLQNQLIGVVSENKDQVLTIANLETKLSGAVLQLKERDDAIANLKTELATREDKQLNLFPPEPEPTPTPEPVTISPVTEPTPTPTPSPEIIKPESTPQPEPSPEPTDTTGTLTRGELAKYILEKLPDSDLGKTKDFEKIYNAIGDAVRDKDKQAKGKEFSRLFYLEKEFGFKFVGKIGKENRFKLV